MWFKKNKQEEPEKTTVQKDNEMSKIIDEVLEEQAAAKEAAMKEAAENADREIPSAKPTEQPSAAADTSLAKLIENFLENRSNETLQAVLEALLPSKLLIPSTPVEGSEDREKKTIQFKPTFIKNKEGELFFPAFSDKSQVPEDYGKRFSLVAMPFGVLCELIVKIPDCEKIIVNPFTKPFTVNGELSENVAKAAELNKNANGSAAEFSLPEPGTKQVADKIAERMRAVPEIRAAYFSKMKNRGKVSYVFAIDCPAEKTQEVFGSIIEFLKAERIALPITLLPYSQAEKAIKESGKFKKVY